MLLPDNRPWKVRQREDLRIRDRRGYKRPDTGRKRDRRGYKRPDAGRKRNRRGYKRPDAGKRPKTHRGATRSSRYRKSGGNTQRATSMCGASPTVKQEQFTSKETEEEKEDEEKQHKCNSVFGCGKCFCDQCYPPGDLPEQGSFQTMLIAA